MSVAPGVRRRLRGKRPPPVAYRRKSRVKMTPTIYVFPRLWFAMDRERFVGPAGLYWLDLEPCGEDGTYAAVVTGTDPLQATVYESTISYDCFSPAGPWRRVGRLCDIRGVQILMGKDRYLGLSGNDQLFDFITNRACRHMRCVYTYRAGFYLRVDVRRCDSFAIYRLSGIASIDEWWHAAGYAFAGVLTFEAMCRMR